MKKNCFVKRIFCVVAACFLFASSLCAISWSGVIDDNTKISTSEFLEFSLFQSNGVYFSVILVIPDYACHQNVHINTKQAFHFHQ